MTEKPKVQVKIYLRPQTRDTLKRQSKIEGVPMSLIVEELVMGLVETGTENTG